MLDFFLLLGAFIIGIIMHEAGHYIVAKNLGGEPRVGVDLKGVYVEHSLSGDERVDVIRGGVFMGYAPGVLLLFISFNMGVLYLLVYTLSVMRELYISLRGELHERRN